MIEFMRPKQRRLGPDSVLAIVRRMDEQSFQDEEIARFLALWRQSDRVMTIFAWLARPEDAIDRRLYEFLRECLLVDD